MVTVTEAAKQELRELLASANIDDPDVCLRLAPQASGQLGLVPDKEREGDHVVEHEGSKVLLVASQVDDLLVGVTIDCQETSQGRRLVASRE